MYFLYAIVHPLSRLFGIVVTLRPAACWPSGVGLLGWGARRCIVAQVGCGRGWGCVVGEGCGFWDGVDV